MKFGRVIEYNKRNIFLQIQKSCTKSGKKTSSRPLFVFIKVLYEVKANGLGLNLACSKNKLYKTLDPEIDSILII